MNQASLSSPRRARRGRARRLLGVVGPVGLFLALGGTTPGSVGSCSDTDPAQDFVEFCNVYEQVVCIRKQRSAEPCEDVPAGVRCYDAELCTAQAIARDCAAAGTWERWSGMSCTPAPTTEEANLCLLVLTDPASGYDFSVPEETIPECMLCQ